MSAATATMAAAANKFYIRLGGAFAFLVEDVVLQVPHIQTPRFRARFFSLFRYFAAGLRIVGRKLIIKK
jgi:hypothetical protein